MIRINLLPVRAAKKKESIRFQLTVAGLITFCVLAINVAVYFVVRGEASAFREDIAKGEAEIEDLKKKIGELSKIKEQKRVVEEKLKVITNLEAARTGPAKLFTMISGAMPEKAWLASLKDEGASVVLKGFASNEEVVADMMRGLQKHKELGFVELDVAQRTVERETNADVISFTIRLEKGKPN